MSDQTPRSIQPGGFFPELGLRIKLILRLIADRRVSPLLKALPLVSVVYLLVPTDLLPLIPLDDAAVLYLGGTLFIEMCPSEIVEEHMNRLRLEAQNRAVQPGSQSEPPTVIDGEFHDVDEP